MVSTIFGDISATFPLSVGSYGYVLLLFCALLLVLFLFSAV